MDLFPSPKEKEFINELALEIYNYCVDNNNYISPDWFEYWIAEYGVEEVSYMAHAMNIIKHTILGFDDEIDNIKNKGKILSNKALELMKASGKFSG